MDELYDVLSNNDRSKSMMVGLCNDGGLGNYELVDNLVSYKYKGNSEKSFDDQSESLDSFQMIIRLLPHENANMITSQGESFIIFFSKGVILL